MKKIVAFFLVIVIIIFGSVSSVFAEGEKAAEKNLFYDSVSYTCAYDSKIEQIVISGTVDHGIMTSFSDYSIEIYSLEHGESFEQMLLRTDAKALASSAMSMKFTFNLPVSRIEDRYLRYTVALVSPSGEKYMAAHALLPSVASEESFSDGTSFKGIMLENASIVGNSGAGMVIVDVNLSELIGDISDSILYPMDDTYIYIKKSYVSELDKMIVTASASDAKVYLRLLINRNDETLAYRPTENGEGFSAPNVYSKSTVSVLYAISRFFAERYDGDNGVMAGAILGTPIDVILKETMTEDDLGVCVDIYATYADIVGNALRMSNATLDVAFPVSDNNSYSSTNEDKVLSRLIDAISKKLDEQLSSAFNCSLVVESSYVPFDISNGGLSKKIDMSVADNSRVHAKNISILTSFIKQLSRSNNCAPKSIIYLWDVPQGLVGNALCSAYAYNYYSLKQNSQVVAFVTRFEDDSAYEGLECLFRYIDTKESNTYTAPLLKYFGQGSWKDIIGSDIVTRPVSTVFEVVMTEKNENDHIGEFTYIDFSSSSTLEFMNKGYNCTALKSEHTSEGERAMCVYGGALKVRDSVECIGLLGYKESYKYTPQMSLTLCVTDDNADSNSLYEVSLTFGDGTERIVACGIVRGGEKTELCFDISQYGDVCFSDYFKISVRAMTRDTQSCSVWLYSIKGYSTQYFSEDLNGLIEEQRQQIQNSGDNDENNSKTVIFTIVGIVFAMVVVGIGLMMVFRKEEYIRDAEDTDDAKNKE